mmetsp:Transcript_7813/g.11546  ORF Transcript_7813/g.11546 Transcript_7813/m.11546 type:complete len:87 (+) Transcript_7813:1265-1525(+)
MPKLKIVCSARRYYGFQAMRRKLFQNVKFLPTIPSYEVSNLRTCTKHLALKRQSAVITSNTSSTSFDVVRVLKTTQQDIFIKYEAI